MFHCAANAEVFEKLLSSPVDRKSIVAVEKRGKGMEFYVSFPFESADGKNWIYIISCLRHPAFWDNKVEYIKYRLSQRIEYCKRNGQEYPDWWENIEPYYHRNIKFGPNEYQTSRQRAGKSKGQPYKHTKILLTCSKVDHDLKFHVNKVVSTIRRIYKNPSPGVAAENFVNYCKNSSELSNFYNYMLDGPSYAKWSKSHDDVVKEYTLKVQGMIGDSPNIQYEMPLNATFVDNDIKEFLKGLGHENFNKFNTFEKKKALYKNGSLPSWKDISAIIA